MKKNKKDIYYCFRYKCKNCPKNRICEEGENNGKQGKLKDTNIGRSTKKW